MTSETTLIFRTGYDKLLTSLSLAAPLCGILAFMASPGSFWARMGGIAACMLAAILARRHQRAPGPQRLVLFVDGRAQWQDKDGQWLQGELRAQCWCTGRYAVVTMDSKSGTRRFLISSSLQKDAHFRRLLAWLRLGVPQREDPRDESLD